MRFRKSFLAFILLFSTFYLFGSGGPKNGHNIVHLMTNLVFQVGIIVFAAKLGEMAAEKVGLPNVLGQIVVGIIIGPYLLGGIGFIGFENGFFPVIEGASIPITPELYGISTLASIILLFMAGLETDIELFLRYSFVGSIVGIGGLIISFAVGALSVMLFFETDFMDPRALFMGVIATATSIGVTARILSKRRSMDIPEGVTILAGAVVDDVLGVITLAVVLGIAATKTEGAS